MKLLPYICAFIMGVSSSLVSMSLGIHPWSMLGTLFLIFVLFIFSLGALSMIIEDIVK